MISEKTQSKVGIFAIGANPIDTDGEQYISETNRWFPVWLYVTVICEDLLSVEESNMGFYPKHLKTVESIRNGKAKEYGDKSFLHDETFTFSVDDVEEFSKFCGLSGGFHLS